ncbi:MAG: TIGR03862 family flavoprotein [Burkholderiaceae bacterium]
MTDTTKKQIAIIGGGPAGLMAAQEAIKAGLQVDVYDAMPSVGRKFLLAGKGGLNLTHTEAAEPFVSRFGSRSSDIGALLAQFGAAEVQAWAHGLGVETFVGSSGRVFPKDMKAAPLLRAWLHQLRVEGVRFHMRHRWLGWAESAQSNKSGHHLQFATPTGEVTVHADAVVLAMGGGSWARLGSDGAWVPVLQQQGVNVKPLLPSNCGFDVGWSAYFAEKFAGQPFKTVAITVQSKDATDSGKPRFQKQGEFVATSTGVEGSLVYAASSWLRDDIAANGTATFLLDLLPDRTAEQVLAEVKHPRGSRSLVSHLKSRLKLDGIKVALLYEILGKDAMNDAVALAAGIKALPITLKAARPIDEAISSAGGVTFEGMNAALMLQTSEKLTAGVFCAGEMLDWEAPTGGYLLTACLSSGFVAGQGAVQYLST